MGEFHQTMSIRLTVLALAAIAVANAEMMTMYTNTPTSDPAGNHCQDFTADMSTADAQQWWSANSYAYPATQGWTNGSVCDPKTYPVVEQHEHPIGVNDVTLRRCGKKVSATLAEAASEKISIYEVGDNHCTLLSIDMAKNGTECLTYQWWTDNAWHYDGWTKGTCDRSVYNWWNRNSTVAEGV